MKLVKKLIKDGIDKKEIFERATKEGLDQKKVSRYLAAFPDKKESEQYDTANKILMGIYIVLVLIGLLAATELLAGFSTTASMGILAFALILPGAVLYFIYQKQSMGYLVLCIFLIKGMMDSLRGPEAGAIWILIGIVINIALLIFVVMLKNKLFPFQNFFGTKKNSEGIVAFTKDATGQTGKASA